MKFSIIRALLVASICMVVPLAQAADPIVIRFSHVVSPNTPKGRAAERFKAEAERRTGGRVKVEIYPNSTLYKDDDEGLVALQQNKVQIMVPSVSKIGKTLGVPDFEVFDLPYIFPSRDMLRRVTEGPIGAGLLKKLETKGVEGLAFWDNGFKVMSANRPLRTPADFKGLNMRIQPSAVLAAQMHALGAIPHQTALKAGVEGIKSGKFDGTENPPSNLYTQKMYEYQKYVTVSNHGYLGYAVIANKQFWDGLPGYIRIQLKLAMIDATRYANLYAEAENKQALDKIRASGKCEVYDLSPDEREVWRRALMPVHRQMEATVGKELLQAIYKEGAAVGYKF